jgi:hypothetical protein
MISRPSGASTDRRRSVSAVPAGRRAVATKDRPGARSRLQRRTRRPFARRPILADPNRDETETPAFARPPSILRLTAASRFACCGGPIRWIGYQNWLQVFVSRARERRNPAGCPCTRPPSARRKGRPHPSDSGPRRIRIHGSPRSTASFRAPDGDSPGGRRRPPENGRSRRKNPRPSPRPCTRSERECWRTRTGRWAPARTEA